MSSGSSWLQRRASSAALEGDTRQADDVGFPRGEDEEPSRVATDQDRRAGSLDRKRVDRMAGHTIVPTGEGDLLALEQSLDDGDCLRQPLDPGGARVEREPRLVVLGLRPPSAEAELEPAIGQEVHRRGLARDHDGMPEVVVEYC